MQYKVVMCDLHKDERIERVIEAKCVFDAIDIAADEFGNPQDIELIEASPIM